ncbi:MAG: ABC transporter substrate-binding protein [Actinobacteria bacterium]|nr:ABC transporter substrate-binding protein [Actinomycetota bacterium]
MARKKTWLVLLTATLSLLVALSNAGCGKGGGAEQPKVTELVVGMGEDANSPDFAEIGVLSPNANIYESLVRLTPEFTVAPMLAESWEYVGDNTWRFHLRKGVKFHNGDELTSEAVKFTYDGKMRPSGKSLLHLKEVKVVDEYTIDIVTEEPNMVVPEIITHPLYGIRCPGTDPGVSPVGTGPFRFVSYEKEKELVVEKNPDYWGEPARLEKLVFKYIPDANTRLMALQAGEVDVIKDIPREMIADIESDESLYTYASQPGGPYVVFEVRTEGPVAREIMADVRLRKAVAVAIDKSEIVEKVWSNNAVVDYTWLPEGMFGAYRDLIQGYDYDPDEAAKLLEEAGWKEGADGIREKAGKRLEITLVSGYPTAAVLKPIPEVIQQQLKAVGIDAKIVEVSDEGVYEEMLKQGEGDLWLTRGTQNNADPTFGPQLLHHSKGYYGEFCGNPWWGGEEFDALVDKARATEDPDERAELVAEAMHILIDEHAALIPIASLFNVYAARLPLEGLVPHPSDVSTRWENTKAK